MGANLTELTFQQRGDRNSWNGTSRCDFYDDDDDDDDNNNVKARLLQCDNDDDDDYNIVKVRLLRLQRDK